MENLEEYIITLKSKDDLDAFYDDMETSGGNLYIPNRAVDVAHKRPISRNTHYMLTANEAELIKQDPRVLAVIAVKLIGTTIPCWTTPPQKFSKSHFIDTVEPTYNWGIKRCIDGTTSLDWYPTSSPFPAGANENIISSVTTELSGKNVDVIIVDAHFNPDHPTFSLNSDGTGGSRVNQFNWFSLNDIVQPAGTAPTDYDYISHDPNENHGAHVAGIAVGNENGWARDANIYNINPYGLIETATNYLWDYIRAFHTTKPINPETGLKNPTICNCSFATGYTFPSTYLGPITQVMYRGTLVGDGVTPITYEQFLELGLDGAATGSQFLTAYSDAVAVDILDAVADGIIFVTAAGNDSIALDLPGGVDYDNYVVASFVGTDYAFDMNRGSTQATFPGAICVGNAAMLPYADQIQNVGYKFTDDDVISGTSNVGPAISLFAPGDGIVSAGNLAQPAYASVSCPSPSNPLYRNMRMSGTSMASPQVCGVLACILERYPRFTQADALEYIVNYAKLDQLRQIPTVTTPYYDNSRDLQGAPNLYLYMPRERPSIGKVYPKVNYRLRQLTGNVYPRRTLLPYK